MHAVRESGSGPESPDAEIENVTSPQGAST
jgi:hypothetical protein